MTGRRRTYTRPCSTAGCRETSQIEYTARRDIEGISKTWTCRSHDKPNETLSPANLGTTAVLALHPLYIGGYRAGDPPRLVGYFWGPEGAEKGSHGIASGPGFWAEAKNFPPGTRLIVTARVELPVESEQRDPDRVVAYRSTGARVLRCLNCYPDETTFREGDLHPVTSEDLPDGGLCTKCGVDVLIPQQPKEH